MKKGCAAFKTTLYCGIKFSLPFYFDPLAHIFGKIWILHNNHTRRNPDALDRKAKFLEILFKSPHFLIGAAIWAYGAYWLLAV